MRIRKKTGLIKGAHNFLRQYSVPLAVIVVTLFIFSYRKMTELPTFLPKPLPGLEVFYKGINVPANNNETLQQAFAENDASIISIPLIYDTASNTTLPIEGIETIYKNNALPLLEWVPFQNNAYVDSTTDKLMLQTAEGKYDEQFSLFAKQLASLGRPVFIKPVLTKNTGDSLGKVSPANYIAAWRHMYEVFENAGAGKAVWVWQAWNDAAAIDYFPGSYYADWLGVNISDSVKERNETYNQGFYSLYHPYHKQPLFNYGIPVMVTAGEPATADNASWWHVAEKNMDTAFKEIRSVIISDKKGSTKNLFASFAKSNFEKDISSSELVQPKPSAAQHVLPDTLKGILYEKGFFWFRNRHTMTKRSLDFDINNIKNMGINTVERSMPGFYDGVMDELLRNYNIKQIGRFTTQASTEELEDDKKMEAEKQKVLKVVRDNRNKSNIIAWNLGTDILYNLENQTYKPDYDYYRNKYVNWLSGLCDAIRAIDNKRPIITDLNWDVNGKKRLQFYKEHVPQIDKYMLVASIKYKEGLAAPLTEKMAWGRVPVELWDSLPAIKKSGFIPAWQDIENTDYISLNGLLDLEGRKKNHYYTVAHTWDKSKIPTPAIPDIKILKPAKTTRESTELDYHIMYRQGTKQWKLYDNKVPGLWFDWYLVRVDQYNNTMFIKRVGEGKSLRLTVPKDPQYYRLFVEAVIDKDVKVTTSTLNTPLE